MTDTIDSMVTITGAEYEALKAEVERLNKTLISATTSLAAAISLLERGGKKAAPSDTMFEQMLEDYRRSLDAARAILTPQEPRHE